MKKIVVTGAAGFIGSHLTTGLLNSGFFDVVALDSFAPAYDPNWCLRRAGILEAKFDTRIQCIDLATVSPVALAETFQEASAVIHLAAWPGVRSSQLYPIDYSRNNLVAFCNVLEAIKISKPELFMFASSSSIYGDTGISGPVSEDQATGKNLRSYYAATKWANEILAKSHCDITNVPTIALRFFTVYGEYGRPDMAYWTFAKKILEGSEVQLYGETGGSRNFTYIDDTVEILSRLLKIQHVGFEALNISAGQPSQTIEMLNRLSQELGKQARVRITERPSVDVEKTWADLHKIQKYVGLTMATPLDVGISKFSKWFLKYGTE